MENPRAIVDRYLAISDAIRRLEESRESARRELVEALGERRGTFAGSRGAVRVIERPTVRLLLPRRVLGALDEGGFLPDVATLQPARLRHAMDGDLAIARVVAPFVETATYTFVGVAGPSAPLRRALPDRRPTSAAP